MWKVEDEKMEVEVAGVCGRLRLKGGDRGYWSIWKVEIETDGG